MLLSAIEPHCLSCALLQNTKKPRADAYKINFKADNTFMDTLENSLKKVKDILVSEDVITYEFSSAAGKKLALVYVDGLVDKAMLGELVIKPLAAEKHDISAKDIRSVLAFPEVKECAEISDAVNEISYGCAVLFIDGYELCFSIGLTKPPGRAVTEPPTQVAVKGPREGFTEDLKVNCALVRKRLKSENLRLDTMRTGKRSDTAVAVCYLDGICDKSVPEKVKQQIAATDIDIIADSSYVGRFISSRPRSLFKRCSTCEKPDIFCAKLCEGRVGLIVDGSPIALTVPYMLTEDFQSAEDYYISSYRATILRFLRLIAVIVGIYLPAMYVAAQLFKLQLIPFKLLLNISSSVSGLPLSPSVEMFLTLFVLEVLNEASVRMPKYVGLAISIVGALVLGETAVTAGIVSTPAIIIVAFSAICLYVVPDLIETTATLRWIFLVIAGSIGTFGIVLFTAFLICYLVTEQAYGVPICAPFSPLVAGDLSDGLLKRGMYSLKNRPASLGSKNKVRLKTKNRG